MCPVYQIYNFFLTPNGGLKLPTPATMCSWFFINFRVIRRSLDYSPRNFAIVSEFRAFDGRPQRPVPWNLLNTRARWSFISVRSGCARASGSLILLSNCPAVVESLAPYSFSVQLHQLVVNFSNVNDHAVHWQVTERTIYVIVWRCDTTKMPSRGCVTTQKTHTCPSHGKSPGG